MKKILRTTGYLFIMLVMTTFAFMTGVFMGFMINCQIRKPINMEVIIIGSAVYALIIFLLLLFGWPENEEEKTIPKNDFKFKRNVKIEKPLNY